MPRDLQPVDFEQAFNAMQAAGEKVKQLASVVQNWNGGVFTEEDKAEYFRQFSEANSALTNAHTNIVNMLYHQGH